MKKWGMKIEEGGLSRIWQHTRDDNTFAIIGSQDKDTKEDRSEELIGKVSKLVRQRNNNIGYKPLWGRYEYEDGTIGEELSLIIFNISKKKALEIAKEINQESIIWKDVGFFGFLTPDGVEDGVFSYNPRNMNFSDEDIKLFGSRLAKHKNKNQLRWFKFVMEEYKPMGRRNAVRNMATRPKREREELFSITESYDAGDTIEYKGVMIEYFPYTIEYGDSEQNVEGWVIKSPYYLQSNSDKPRYYLPLYCEDEDGEEVNFETLDDAKDYIDRYIVTKRGKIRIKHGDEIHYEIL